MGGGKRIVVYPVDEAAMYRCFYSSGEWTRWVRFVSNSDNIFEGKQTISSPNMTFDDAYLRIVAFPGVNTDSRASIYFCNQGVMDTTLFLENDGFLCLKTGTARYRINMTPL